MLEKKYIMYKLNKSIVEDKDSFLLDISHNDGIDSHFYYFIVRNDEGYNVSKVTSPVHFIRKIQEKNIDFCVCEDDAASTIVREISSLVINKKISSSILVDEFGLSKLDSNGIRNLFSLLVKATPKKNIYK